MKRCKRCGRKIPDDRKRCLYCQKRKSYRAKKDNQGIGRIILAVSNALAKSAAKRTSEYRYYADLFKDSKKKYRG